MKMYGAMIDLTGDVSGLRLYNSKRKGSWEFHDGTPAQKGERWHGDGRDYRVTFCNPDPKKVKLWLKGTQAKDKLLRSSLVRGK